MESTSKGISSTCVRDLLRKLRDVNLTAYPILIRSGLRVVVDGCLSLDAPIEGGVRYKLSLPGGDEGVMLLHWASGKLEIDYRDRESAKSTHALRVDLASDNSGGTLSRALRARVRAGELDPRSFERFLRRSVRCLFARRDPAR